MRKFLSLVLSINLIVGISFLINNNMHTVTGQDNENASGNFLFIQSATSGSLVPNSKNSGEDGSQTLVLTLTRFFGDYSIFRQATKNTEGV